MGLWPAVSQELVHPTAYGGRTLVSEIRGARSGYLQMYWNLVRLPEGSWVPRKWNP